MPKILSETTNGSYKHKMQMKNVNFHGWTLWRVPEGHVIDKV